MSLAALKGEVGTMATERTLKLDQRARQIIQQRLKVMEFDPGANGVMHRTETIDYIACLEGELDMDMDDSTVTLRAGDVMVQRGTNHAWVNRSKARARLAIVLIDAKPLGIGHPRKEASVPAPERQK